MASKAAKRHHVERPRHHPVLGLLIAVLLGLSALGSSACLLTNINPDACESDRACVEAFGLGSSCVESYCSEPTACQTGHDCRARHGGGACVDKRCVDHLPADPVGACKVFEPTDLPNKALTGKAAPLIIGGMFLLEVDFGPPIVDAAKLALREINDVGGLIEGQPIGMVVCDNGGPGNALVDDARLAHIHAVVDYLAGTLGVPFMVGPLTSGDSLHTVQWMLARGYPTVMISPSATSPALTNEPDKLSEEDYGLFWRTPPSDQLQGKVLANNVVGKLPVPDMTLTKIAAVYRDDAYGLGLATAFQQSFSGTTTLHKFAVDAALAPLATEAAAMNPDGVMFVDIGGDRAVAFMTEMAASPAIAAKPLFLADGSKNSSLLDSELTAEVKTIIFNQAVGTVAAAPAGPDYDLFAASYMSEFMSTAANSAFVANGYDAVYVGAAAVVFAAQNGSAYNGRHVAGGLARLINGATVRVGKLTWSDVKNGLTTGNKEINIVGVSGPLDFDVSNGDTTAPIEVWKPSNQAGDCSGSTPCFEVLETVEP